MLMVLVKLIMRNQIMLYIVNAGANLTTKNYETWSKNCNLKTDFYLAQGTSFAHNPHPI